MAKIIKRCSTLARFALIVTLSCVTVLAVHAALVDLDAFVEEAILDTISGGGNPLADGSYVYIIGSGDDTAGPMQTYGAPPTNYLGYSVTGDDVILGVIQIGTGVNSNGTFDVTVQYESDDIDYVYIRYFDTTGLLTGLLEWGTSPVFEIPAPIFGVSTVQFDENGTLRVQNEDNFVIIPEPSTAHLMLLFFGMMWSIRARTKNEERRRKIASFGNSTSSTS